MDVELEKKIEPLREGKRNGVLMKLKTKNVEFDKGVDLPMQIRSKLSLSSSFFFFVVFSSGCSRGVGTVSVLRESHAQDELLLSLRWGPNTTSCVSCCENVSDSAAK